MKVQAITTNYSTQTNKKLSSRRVNNQGQNANNVNFRGFPLLHEREGRFWKITGEEILSASKEQLRNWAEYLHKKDYIPEAIYTITKPHWWSGEKVDGFKTGVAYERMNNAIEKVREYKKTASPSEIARLDKKAEKCEEDLTEIRTYLEHMGSV